VGGSLDADGVFAAILQRYEVRDKVTTIGRETGLKVRIHDAKVSRIHASLIINENKEVSRQSNFDEF
jgi:pSer/pThr/pTyr-binding forkhead associated (FHA) protein